MQLEQMFRYQPRVAQEERQQTYFVVGDLDGLSASALYTGDSGSSGSGFVTASSFGIGPGIAKESEGFIERYRAGEHENYGKDHVNLEYISPVTLKPLINIHIDMKDE